MNIRIIPLVFSLLLTSQASAYAGEWLNKLTNSILGLDTSIVEVSNLEYATNWASDMIAIANGSSAIQATGRVLNKSNDSTIKFISFIYEVLECNSSGKNCTTIDEERHEWTINIPPRQARYFDWVIDYSPGSSSRSIYFRQNIEMVR
jgi:hypothetical protein